MWRWSLVKYNAGALKIVFSTYVEMILRLQHVVLLMVRVLHVCGDDPRLWSLQTLYGRCSPRMWRWSLLAKIFLSYSFVFSTYVEMILFLLPIKLWNTSVLHVCGDDPISSAVRKVVNACSPRMWRWSYFLRQLHNFLAVFSTYVEMILNQALFRFKR